MSSRLEARAGARSRACVRAAVLAVQNSSAAKGNRGDSKKERKEAQQTGHARSAGALTIVGDVGETGALCTVFAAFGYVLPPARHLSHTFSRTCHRRRRQKRRGTAGRGKVLPESFNLTQGSNCCLHRFPPLEHTDVTLALALNRPERIGGSDSERQPPSFPKGSWNCSGCSDCFTRHKKERKTNRPICLMLMPITSHG